MKISNTAEGCLRLAVESTGNVVFWMEAAMQPDGSSRERLIISDGNNVYCEHLKKLGTPFREISWQNEHLCKAGIVERRELTTFWARAPFTKFPKQLSTLHVCRNFTWVQFAATNAYRQGWWWHLNRCRNMKVSIGVRSDLRRAKI